MEKKDKTKVKAVFDYMKKFTKSKKQTIELCPGLSSKVEYVVLFNGGDWEVDVISEKIIVKKEVENILNFLGVDLDDQGLDYVDFIDLGDYEAEFIILASKADIDDDDWHWFDDDAIQNTWTDWWTDFSEEFEKPEEVKYQPVFLNRTYKAIIDKKNQSVVVGCQTIPIAAIRNIIAEYDKEV